jgi:hypothetical protein
VKREKLFSSSKSNEVGNNRKQELFSLFHTVALGTSNTSHPPLAGLTTRTSSNSRHVELQLKFQYRIFLPRTLAGAVEQIAIIILKFHPTRLGVSSSQRKARRALMFICPDFRYSATTFCSESFFLITCSAPRSFRT